MSSDLTKCDGGGGWLDFSATLGKPRGGAMGNFPRINRNLLWNK